MANQDFTKIPVEFDLKSSSGIDVLKVAQAFKQLERVIETLSKDGLSFASTLKRTENSLKQDFYVQSNYKKNAQAAFRQVESGFAREDSPVNPMAMGSSSKVEMIDFQQKIVASKRELAAIQAEISSMGGRMSPGKKAGYYDVSVPDVPMTDGDFSVQAPDLVKGRIGSANMAARDEKALMLSSKNPRAYSEYLKRKEEIYSRRSLAHEKEEEALASQIPRTKDGHFDKRASNKIREYENRRAWNASAGMTKENEETGVLDSILGDGGEDDTGKDASKKTSPKKQSGALDSLKGLAKFYLLVKGIKLLIDIAQKILASIDRLTLGVKTDGRSGVGLRMSPLRLMEYRRMEMTRGLAEGTVEGAMQKVQDSFGVTQKMDDDFIKAIAPVVGDELTGLIQMGVKAGSMTPEQALNTILNSFMARADSAHSSLGVPMGSKSEAAAELSTVLSGLDSNIADLFSQMFKDSMGKGNPGLSEAALNSFISWMAYGNDAVANPTLMTNDIVEKLVDIHRVLGELKGLMGGFMAGLSAHLAMFFEPLFLWARNASREFMSKEAAEADVLAARGDAEARLGLGYDTKQAFENVEKAERERSLEAIRESTGGTSTEAARLYNMASRSGGDMQAFVEELSLSRNEKLLTLFNIGYSKDGDDLLQNLNTGNTLDKTGADIDSSINALEEELARSDTRWTNTNFGTLLVGSLAKEKRKSNETWNSSSLLDSLGFFGKGAYESSMHSTVIDSPQLRYLRDTAGKHANRQLENASTRFSVGADESRAARDFSTELALGVLTNMAYSSMPESLKKEAAFARIKADPLDIQITLTDAQGNVLYSESRTSMLQSSFSDTLPISDILHSQ